MAVRVIPVEPFDLVIFGGTGDLARRATHGVSAAPREAKGEPG